MRVLICSNCGGFGVTQGPVLARGCGNGEHASVDDAAPAALRQETTLYPCGACEGAGYVHVVRSA